jgi:adenylate kinase family enzyme
MNRILVMGVSAGVGKSTFARKLGDLINIPVVHLDTLYWKPEWMEASLEEFTANQLKIVSNGQWIIEGNYSSTYEIRAHQADTIIYLELPLFICLYRVFKRFIVNFGKNRLDMGKGCKEKIDYKFIKFIITTYFPRKKRMGAKLQAFKEKSPYNHVITLKSKKEIQLFLEEIKTKD